LIRGNKPILTTGAKPDRLAAGSIAEAYLSGRLKYGFFRLGRLNRNWGPFPDRSLILSFKHSFLRCFRMAALLVIFRVPADVYGVPYSNSYIDAQGKQHVPVSYGAFAQFHVRPVRRRRAITETMLFSRPSGLPDLQLVNPFSSYTSSIPTGKAAATLMLCLQWDVRPFANVSLKGQISLMIFRLTIRPATRSPRLGGDFGTYWSNFLHVKQLHTLSLDTGICPGGCIMSPPRTPLLASVICTSGAAWDIPRMTETVFNLSFLLPELISGPGPAASGTCARVKIHCGPLERNERPIPSSRLRPGISHEKSFPSGTVESTFDLYVDARDISGLRRTSRLQWITGGSETKTTWQRLRPCMIPDFCFSLSSLLRFIRSLYQK